MAIKDFACNIHENYLTDNFIKENAALFPQAFYNAPEMADLAVVLGDKAEAPVAMLPFDYMAEAEAMGAKVKWSNDAAGLRGDGHLLNEISQLANLPAIDFTKGRIAEILNAVSLVKKAGYVPCLNLSGFLTITDCLLPIARVFMGWKREKEVLEQFFQQLFDDLLVYAALAQQNHAKIVSYADPLAAISLLGPKMSAELSENYVVPFLKALQKQEGGGIIHLCGKTSYALEQAGLIEIENIDFKESVLYTRALAELALAVDEKIIIGHGCINKKQHLNKLIQIKLL
ncbi:MAG: uroporphyrinogen decarboxylase family protein [Clostridia bacterium]|nr:uroporphyrinogen decarboxylase family protein [Clostridia bacterium]